MPRCPSCGEIVGPRRKFCSACGYDFREHRAVTQKVLSPAILIPVGAAVLLGLILLLVFEMTSKKSKAAGHTSARLAQAAGPESLPPKRQPGERSSSDARPTSPGLDRSLAREYAGKIDDLLNKVARERRKLTDSKRLTQKQSDLLSKIESRLRETRGQVGMLDGAPNEESRRAVRLALDNKLADIRKMFGELGP
jgi:chromosome segregation ATPase